MNKCENSMTIGERQIRQDECANIVAWIRANYKKDDSILKVASLIERQKYAEK